MQVLYPWWPILIGSIKLPLKETFFLSSIRPKDTPPPFLIDGTRRDNGVLCHTRSFAFLI